MSVSWACRVFVLFCCVGMVVWMISSVLYFSLCFFGGVFMFRRDEGGVFILVLQCF